MKSNEYKCAKCGGVFQMVEGREEEATKEYEENNSEFMKSFGADIVCDSCYQKYFKDIVENSLI